MPAVQLKDYTDKELLLQYMEGEDVMSELYIRYNNLVLGSCLKHLKNRAEAEDAVSDIFVLISEKLKTHNVESFKSWLFTVTRNHCIEILRKKSRHRDKKNTADSMYSEAIFHPDDVEDIGMLKKLEKCIGLLPDKQQKTIQLFYFQKVSYKDIASQLDLSWDKVRSFIQNGRRNLKNCLEQK